MVSSHQVSGSTGENKRSRGWRNWNKKNM